jgi:6-phosphofructokinase 1
MSTQSLRPGDLEVLSLGTGTHPSPLVQEGRRLAFVPDGARILDVAETGPHMEPGVEPLSFERAGPRQTIHFEPSKVTAAVATCGGLAPGLNNVIRSLYLELTENYGVPRVLGIREGYRGLVPGAGLPPLELSSKDVHSIHDRGGTILGSSRGPQDPGLMVDFLESMGVDVLFCVGGDGTQRGAHVIHEEIARRGLDKAVVGIPKTIDNDVPFVWMSFGYITALSKAEEVLRAAHTEAHDAPNGVGLVKLMGRNAGFIAAGAAVASQEANFVLVPEVPFPLDRFLDALEQRVADRGHALVVVAEGAGQHLLDAASRDARDASGNRLHQDIGLFLADAMKSHFQAAGRELNLKYFDPGYLIRSVPANGWDRVLCDHMARHAVHAAMAGRTDVLIGFQHGQFLHVPIPAAARKKKRMEVPGDLWSAVLSATGQPSW